MPFKYFVLYVVLCFSCSNAPEDDNAATENEEVVENEVLAQVYQKRLYLSDVAGFLPAIGSSEDSIGAIKTQVQKWVKEQLFLRESELNTPSDIDIDKLVADYRASLVKHNYEKKLIETKLDTVVTEYELRSHYEQNKEQYKLENNILRCLFMKVRKPVRDKPKIESWFQNPTIANISNLQRYCVNNAEYCLLNNDKWYNLEEVLNYFPTEFDKTSFKTGLVRNFADFDYHYFIHILEYVSKRSNAPIEFFEDRAVKLIIRQRKNRLIEEIKTALFEKEKKSRNVKIFIE